MIYDCNVVFGADEEPWPSKWGGFTWNIKVEPDDPSAPGIDENGHIRLYKDTESAEGKFIKTLKPGDRVTIVWIDSGKHPHYKVRIPASTPQAQAPRPQAPVSQSQPTPQASKPVSFTVSRLTDGDVEAWRVGLDNMGDLFDDALGYVAGRWPDLEDKVSVARTLFSANKATWRQGATVETVPETGDKDKFLDNYRALLEDNDETAAWAKAASSWFDLEMDDIVDAVRKLHINSPEWIGDDDQMWLLAQISNDYVSMIEDGADESVAVTAMVDKHGIKRPPSDPLF